MHSRKGQDTLQWAFVSLLIALLFITFAINPMQKSVEEVARNNEKVVMQELVTAINLAEASYDLTDYKTLIPARGRDKCTIEIKNGIIRAEFLDGGKKNVILTHYIVTPVKVYTELGSVDCKAGALLVERQKNGVVIKSAGA
jgi:hypothetical protein